jgi:hypothetical protein
LFTTLCLLYTITMDMANPTCLGITIQNDKVKQTI